MYPNRLSKLPGTVVGIDPTPIDLNILKELNSYEIDIEYAHKCMDANKHNHISATYYLLLKKHLKEGGTSVADTRNVNYNPKAFS
jgi:5'-AMP-activated protein kinase catalytic alpha subunit